MNVLVVVSFRLLAENFRQLQGWFLFVINSSCIYFAINSHVRFGNPSSHTIICFESEKANLSG